MKLANLFINALWRIYPNAMKRECEQYVLNNQIHTVDIESQDKLQMVFKLIREKNIEICYWETITKTHVSFTKLYYKIKNNRFKSVINFNEND